MQGGAAVFPGGAVWDLRKPVVAAQSGQPAAAVGEEGGCSMMGRFARYADKVFSLRAGTPSHTPPSPSASCGTAGPNASNLTVAPQSPTLLSAGETQARSAEEQFARDSRLEARRKVDREMDLCALFSPLSTFQSLSHRSENSFGPPTDSLEEPYSRKRGGGSWTSCESL